MSSGSGILPPWVLLCPDCRTNSVDRGDGGYACVTCGRSFSVEVANGRPVYNLLPGEMEECKRNEEFASAGRVRGVEGSPDPSTELHARQVWRYILVKAEEVRFFERHLLGLVRPGRVLELGAGSCWASSLVKLRHPGSEVHATDVSPTYLGRVSTRLARIMGAGIDHFVACDAENVPFVDEHFDTVFIHDSMHHLPDISRMLREAYRVLKPGGNFFGNDGIVPGFWKNLLFRGSERRANRLGVLERAIPVRGWHGILAEAGVPGLEYGVILTGELQRSPLRMIAAAVLGRLPARIVKHVSPCGILVRFEKPLDG